MVSSSSWARLSRWLSSQACGVAYNDFFAENGKIYPRLKQVAGDVGLHQHVRELLAAVRAAGIQLVIAPHRRWRPGDFDGWLRPGRPHQAIRLPSS